MTDTTNTRIQQIVEQLVELGGSEWQTHDGAKHRVYFDPAVLAGFEKRGDRWYWGTYRLSRSEACAIHEGRIWVDLIDGGVHTQGFREFRSWVHPLSADQYREAAVAELLRRLQGVEGIEDIL